MAKTEMPSEEKAKFIFEVVEDRKAIEPKLLDLRGKTVLADYFLICAGFNQIHIKAIAEHVLDEAKERSLSTPRTMGEQVGEWVLIDFGDVVVHIMTEEARDRYKLEEYWTTPQPKGALPPMPGSLAASEFGGIDHEEGMFDDEDDFDDEEDDDALFFDAADAEVEPIDEDDEDYEEGSEEQDELDDYDEPDDIDPVPAVKLASDTDEGATFAGFDETKNGATPVTPTVELFEALDNNAQPGRSDAELDNAKTPTNMPDAAKPSGTADGVGEASTR